MIKNAHASLLYPDFTDTGACPQEGQDIYQRGMYLEAIEYWKKAAAAGDAGSAYRLSEEYFDAKIVGRAIRYLMQDLH